MVESTGSGSSQSQRARVWVVDDSPLESQRICKLLANHYEVDAFSEGAAMLEKISAGIAPELVLLDWQMPGVSGLEACRFLRGRYDEVTLPILMLTSRGAREDFTEGLSAGANDYVAKPYDDSELLARVRGLVRTRQQTEAIRTREERFATTLRSIGDAVITTDPQGRVTFMNGAAETLTGCPTVDAVGKPFDAVFDVFDGVSRAKVESPVRAVQREGRRVGLTGDLMLRRPDGSEVPIEENATPIGEGSSLGMVVVLRDVTDRKKAERETKEHLDFEEKLIGIVSHDLRNPLNVIFLGATSMLRRDDLDERITKTMMRIQSSAERANRLVGDLLDFTRARLGGGIPVVFEPADVNELVGKTVEEVQAEHPERDIRIEREGEANGELDPERLSQVILNLLSNAVKYGLKTGEIVIRTRGLTDAVLIEVHNQGAPIAPALIPEMFQAMKRGVVDRADRSVGLGLYIVKHIVDAHHGTIEVRSNADEGTTFSVRLPRTHSTP